MGTDVEEKKSPDHPSTIKRHKARNENPDAWKPLFLSTLQATGIVRLAAKAANIDKSTAYDHKKSDKAFEAQWVEAVEDSIELLEAEARRRALHGTDKPVFQGGKQVGTIREYSDTLAIFLLKAHRPTVYRERWQIEQNVNVVHSGSVTMQTDDQLKRIIDSEGAEEVEGRLIEGTGEVVGEEGEPDE